MVSRKDWHSPIRDLHTGQQQLGPNAAMTRRCWQRQLSPKRVRLGLCSLLAVGQISAPAQFVGALPFSPAQDAAVWLHVPIEGEQTHQGGIAGPAVLATRPLAAMEDDVVNAINEIRREHGLSTLRRNARLRKVARRHSQNMLDQVFFSHTDPEGRSAFERVDEAGIPFQLVAENLAWNLNSQNPIKRAVRGWMKSKGHRRNILEPRLRETGVGIARRGQEYYFTQVFIRK